MKLRSNQHEPTSKGIAFFNEPNPRPALIIAPTAFGKSILVAYVAQACQGRTLVLQPSVELLTQNFGKYIALGNQDASIYSASFGQKKLGGVTFATIGTIYKLGKLFKEYGYTNLIIDEAHLFPRALDSMLAAFLTDSGITHTLGLTATPFKLQRNVDIYGNPFSKLVMLTSPSKLSARTTFWKDILHVSQIQEMVDNNFWSPLIYDVVSFDSSKLIYNSAKSDFTEKSVKESYESQYISQKIYKKLDQYKDRKAVLVFAESVAEAREMSLQYPNSAYVHGMTPKKERKQLITDFKAGRIRVMFNVGVLTTGFDHVGIDLIILARPTNSLALYYQILGRGTRIDPYKIKKDCLIVDLCGNYGRFGMIEKYKYEFINNKWYLFGDNDRLLTGGAVDQVFTRKDLMQEIEKTKRVALAKKEAKLQEPIGQLKTSVVDITEITMPFGKFKDQLVRTLPTWYVKYMQENFDFKENFADLKKAVFGRKV